MYLNKGASTTTTTTTTNAAAAIVFLSHRVELIVVVGVIWQFVACR